jgi:hypothetical protein
MGWTTFSIALGRSTLTNRAENNSNNNHQITSKFGDTAGMFSNHHFFCPQVNYSFRPPKTGRLHAMDAMGCNGVQ